jgi:hypothetical protein
MAGRSLSVQLDVMPHRRMLAHLCVVAVTLSGSAAAQDGSVKIDHRRIWSVDYPGVLAHLGNWQSPNRVRQTMLTIGTSNRRDGRHSLDGGDIDMMVGQRDASRSVERR